MALFGCEIFIYLLRVIKILCLNAVKNEKVHSGYAISLGILVLALDESVDGGKNPKSTRMSPKDTGTI